MGATAGRQPRISGVGWCAPVSCRCGRCPGRLVSGRRCEARPLAPFLRESLLRRPPPQGGARRRVRMKCATRPLAAPAPSLVLQSNTGVRWDVGWEVCCVLALRTLGTSLQSPGQLATTTKIPKWSHYSGKVKKRYIQQKLVVNNFIPCHHHTTSSSSTTKHQHKKQSLTWRSESETEGTGKGLF